VSDECIFCQIVGGGSPASFVYQDDAVVVFMDVQPITHGHMLVVPRVHAVLMHELDEDSAMRSFAVAYKVARIVPATLSAGGFNLFVADGTVAFQDVPHFHIHIIPRYENDGFALTFPPSYGQPPPREQLDLVAATLRFAVS
jgi:histidine triad (HIT) family protein